MLLGAVVTPGCGDSSSSGGGLTYRTTTWYHYRTAAAVDVFSQLFILMSTDDVANFGIQCGQNQASGSGLIFGSVRDLAGATSISGATVTAVNDAGLSAGTVFYRNASGVFQPSLTSTSTFSDFIIFNVAAGRINLRAGGTASGNIYVNSVADETTLVTMRCAPGTADATWSGVTRRHTNIPGLAEVSVLLEGLATGSPFPITSNGTTGAFGPNTVPSLQTYLVRASKAGFYDTYNEYVLGSGTITTPVGDLFVVVDTAEGDTNFVPTELVPLTLGASVVRGVVAPVGTSLDGFSIACTDLTGATVGDIRYGDATAVPQPIASLTSTSSSGTFYIYNLPAGGTYFVRATKTGGTSFAGSAYTETFTPIGPATRSVTFMAPIAAVTNASSATTHNVSGSLVTFAGTFGVGNATINRLGNGSTGTNETGQFTMSNIPSNHFFRVKTTRP
jgi:hypothetical protein